MRSSSRFSCLILAFVVLLFGCESGGSGEAPSAELYADPDVCDVPCQVVLDSGVESRADDGVTFQWDVGDGPFEGDARLLHTFETAGAHEVSVTVSRGDSSTTDTITVLAQAQPKTSGTVDVAGGSVSHGPFTVTVPEGLAPEAFPIQVTELPSMQDAAERILGSERFTALGSSYDVVTPAKSSAPLDISVKEQEAAGVDPDELAWLVRLVSRPMPSVDREEAPASLAPLANYVLMPVTSVDADGTAHGEIYGRHRAQLVRLSVPLDLASESGANVAPATKAFATPVTIVLTLDAPTKLTKQQYLDSIFAGVKQAHEELVNNRKFLWPHSSLTVHVKRVDATTDGYVPLNNYNTIHLSNEIKSTDSIKKTIAHEFFHLIQHWNSNWQSDNASLDVDSWFIEGSASWAMDEAFDDIQDRYYATRRDRLERPLLAEDSKEAPFDVYETMAFFKWAETKKTNFVRMMLEHRYAATHKLLAGLPIIVENAVITDYLTSMKSVWSEADFLEYAYAALYTKDFDEEENRDFELWTDVAFGDKLGLGEPKEVFPTLTVGLTTGTGDSENNPAEPTLKTLPHLSSEVLEVQSGDLSGTLHVRFPEYAQPLDARVFVIDTNSQEVEDSFTVRDLSQKRDDVKVAMGPDKTAYVLLVDTQWAYPTTPKATEGKLKVWIEDVCGPVPAGAIEVTDDDELYTALSTASEGSVILMSPGTYRPIPRDWPLPDDGGDVPAHALVENMTLVGSGKGETTLVLRGDEFASVGVVTYGSATIRDLTIDSGKFPAVVAVGAKSLTLCNVHTVTTEDDALYFQQWPGDGNGFLGIYDSSLTYSGTVRHSAMDLQCEELSGDLDIEIRDSQISGWTWGVVYSNYSDWSCSVSLATDCKGFSNNELANVMSVMCTPGDCTNWVEQCP